MIFLISCGKQIGDLINVSSPKNPVNVLDLSGVEINSYNIFKEYILEDKDNYNLTVNIAYDLFLQDNLNLIKELLLEYRDDSFYNDYSIFKKDLDSSLITKTPINTMFKTINSFFEVPYWNKKDNTITWYSHKNKSISDFEDILSSLTFVYKFKTFWKNGIYNGSISTLKEITQNFSSEEDIVSIKERDNLIEITSEMTCNMRTSKNWEFNSHKNLMKLMYIKKEEELKDKELTVNDKALLYDISEFKENFDNFEFRDNQHLFKELDSFVGYKGDSYYSDGNNPISKKTVSFSKKVIDKILLVTSNFSIFPTGIECVQIDFNLAKGFYLEFNVKEDKIVYFSDINNKEQEDLIELEDVPFFLNKYFSNMNDYGIKFL